MKTFYLFLLSFVVSMNCLAQSDPDEIGSIFSSRDDKDIKLYDGFNVQDYNYYYNADTLFYQFYGKEMPLPLSLIDFKTAKIDEEKKWMTINREKVYYLKLHSLKNKHFPTQYDLKFVTPGTDEVTFFFPSKQMAENALQFLKDPHPLQTNTVADDSDLDDAISKILAEAEKNTDGDIARITAKKEDTDFEFTLGSSSLSSFKYFLYNDSLWFSGTELYATVIPFEYINGEKLFSYESGVWKNKDGSKCYEIAVYARTGKRFGQDFKTAWGNNSVLEEKLGGKEITIVSLIVPGKEWADKFIKYLKAKAN